MRDSLLKNRNVIYISICHWSFLLYFFNCKGLCMFFLMGINSSHIQPNQSSVGMIFFVVIKMDVYTRTQNWSVMTVEKGPWNNSKKMYNRSVFVVYMIKKLINISLWLIILIYNRSRWWSNQSITNANVFTIYFSQILVSFLYKRNRQVRRSDPKDIKESNR